MIKNGICYYNFEEALDEVKTEGCHDAIYARVFVESKSAIGIWYYYRLKRSTCSSGEGVSIYYKKGSEGEWCSTNYIPTSLLSSSWSDSASIWTGEENNL
jgi:hypothetical protein